MARAWMLPTAIAAWTLSAYDVKAMIDVVVWSGTQTQSGTAQIKARAEARGSIFLPFRAAVLPRLDSGSGGVKLTLSCVIQNLQASCSSWYMMYET